MTDAVTGMTKPVDPPEMPPPTLSLPKGGGAVRGLRETFAFNAATSTSPLSIPVGLSAARSCSAPRAGAGLRLRRAGAAESLQISEIALFARCGDPNDDGATLIVPTPTASDPAATVAVHLPLSVNLAYGGLHHAHAGVAAGVIALPPLTTPWWLTMTRPGCRNLVDDPVDVHDAILVLAYQRL